ncbi:CLIP-associated protein-like isoform X1 [Zingiber officinale]|uniref:CLIP-associated protein-like isoform X1 n=1 Tax=Zingiber officinale TaxID=94328 RepID=UPI001C4C871D|nr:CLIP-associated protein-like isoform X1 [Zingiber officinale]
MEEALEAARAKDTKERMAGVERLLQVLESTTRSLSSAEVTSLVDTCMDLLKDSNFRVSQGALQALSAAAVLSGDHLKIHFNGLVPAVVERLGDGKQPVREAARQLLITLMEVSSPTIIVERAGSYAWAHRSWRVREEFARTVSTAVGLFASTELPLQRVLLPPVLQLLTDSNQSVREAAASCIEEMYAQVGTQFHEELQRHSLPSSMIKEINARLEKIEPKVLPSDGVRSHISTDNRTASASHKKSSPRTKISTRETSFSSGEFDITEKPVVPIKVFTEKELVKEMEKITSTLVPEKDWSLRISAMQRVEGLVIGGAADYQSFPVLLLKQLAPPICTQLSDRRSSIVKQACHLLNLLSKELLGDFEACAEMFIPVLLKLVVITVLVIAESADHCIKTMLRNCKVARILPRIAEIAKSDKSSVLRARCCDYALLILEYWADAPEIQRAADLYEELIKCCVADAMSEVRSTARTCYRMFTKTWPERSRRLFLSFDPAIQRLINEEDGSIHKRHASPSIRERGLQLSHSSSQASQAFSTGIPGYGTSAIVAMDKGATSSVGTSLSSAGLLSQSKTLRKNPERTLESMLDASKQKVSAIESLLKGVSISGKQSFTSTRSTSLDLGVDAPSTRDPQVPSSVSSNLFPVQGSVLVDSNAANIAKGNNRNGGSNMSEHLTSQVQLSRDSSRSSYFSPSDTLSALSLSYMKRSERLQEGSGIEDNVDLKFSRRISSMPIDKQYLETPYKDSFYRESPNSYIPNFQRPLLRKQVTGRAIASSRKSFDDSQIQGTEIHSYMDGPASLNDALNEGLSASSDWVARVSAFNYLRSLLQQGPKGILEITQHFEKVMKLFFRYLDDPHHKVAQAAFSTLAEIIPVCRKPFESYLERTLPHVFSRLIDPKELVRQPCSTTLEIVSKTYNVDSLLPALVRSLDEQRSPKAKLAVIQFANNSFNKHTINPEGNSNSGFIKLWLGKLSPWVNDKNVRLKEASISGIISVYTHFDSTAVLNFILNLSVEEQNSLRRALKQYTPRIEVDLMTFLQNKKERQRSKSFYDQSDVVGSSSEEGYVGGLKKSHQLGRYSAGSLDDEGGRKWSLGHESTELDASIVHVTSNEIHHSSQNLDEFISDPLLQGTDSGTNCLKKTDYVIEHESSIPTPRLSINRFIVSDGHKPIDLNHGGEISKGSELKHLKNSPVRANLQGDSGPSIPQLLHRICNTSDVNSDSDKTEALQQLVEISSKNDISVWTKYFNQILTAVLEALDDSDPSTRELALSLIFGMLNNQKSEMEDSVEIVIEKLLHVTKDVAVKVSKEANQCLNVVLSEYDPFRFFSVIVPLLVSDDEKTLVVCISCLTKLVSRLPQDDLMKHLPSFLPALFDAFGNQSPDVRKTVVFCLVEIYIKLGKSFLPYLEGLSSTQLRLVTIYANRISQARSGAPIDSSH